MGKQIDEQIVQARFDNKQFESGVKETKKSIEDLKKGLDFTKQAKNLDDLAAAGRRFTLEGISKGIETLNSKFSALGIAGITIIQNLTNTALQAGERIASALTIDPIKTGLSEYETQIGAIQTILANTSTKGTTLNQVNAALAELNAYADKTIYNFTQMTKNIGTFTAAGVDLRTSVSAIKGIANLAAVSGSTADQASTAMYQLSQALAAGSVKLMDWNSVVNAGMGGQVFQDSLKETARKYKIDIDGMIEANGSFRETLQTGWLTTDILTETLSKFTGDLSAAQLKTMGYSEKQITEIIKLGKMANDAATEVKTLSQLFDTLKEAAQSGWSQSWQLIIGDFGEAKKLFTEVSNVIGGVIGDSAKARNALLSTGLSSGWKQLLTEGIADEAAYTDAIIKTAKKKGIAIDEMIKKEGSFAATLKSGWLTSEIMATSLADVTKKTKGLSDEKLKDLGYTREQITALEKFNTDVQNGSKSLDEYAKKMTMMSGRENLIEAISNAFNTLMKILKPIKEAFVEIFPPATGAQLLALTEKIRDFTKKFDVSAQTLDNLKRTFKGVFAVIGIGIQVLSAVGKAIGGVIKTLMPAGGTFLSITAKIGDFLVKLNDAIKASDTFNKIFNKIGSVIKTVFDDVVAIVSGIVGTFNSLGGASTSGIDMFVARVKERFAPLGGIADFFKGVITGIYNIALTILEKIKPVTDKVAGFWKAFFDGLKKQFTDGTGAIKFDLVFDVINGGLLAAIGLGVNKFIKTLTGALGGKEEVSGFKQLIAQLQTVFNSLKDTLKTFQAELKANMLLKIAISVAMLAGALAILSTIDSKKLAVALGAISGLFVDLFGSMMVFGKVSEGSKFDSIERVSRAMIGVSAAVLILAFAMTKLAKLSWAEIAKGLTAIVALTGTMIATAAILSKNEIAMTKGAGSFVIFAGALWVLSKVVKALGSLSLVTIGKGLMTIAGFTAVLVGTAAILSKNEIGIIKGAGSFVIFAGALWVLGNVVKFLGSMNLVTIGKGLLMVATLTGVLVGTAAILSKNEIGIIKGAGAFIIFGGALAIMANVVKTLGTLNLITLGKGLGALIVIMGSLLLFTNMAQSSVLGALSLVIIAGALMVIAGAIKVLGSMPLASIGKALLAIAGIFVVLGLAGLVLGPITPLILALAIAVGILGVGLLSVGVGMLAFATGLAILAGLGSVSIMGITFIIAQMAKLIPMILGEFAKGFIAFLKILTENGVTILNFLKTLLLSLVQALVTVIPPLIKALFVLVTTFLTELAKAMPQIVEAGFQIIMALLRGIEAHIGEIVTSAVNIMTNFLKALGDKMPDIIAAGADFFVKLIKGFADAIKTKSGDILAAMVDLVVAISVSIGKMGRFIAEIGKLIIDGIVAGFTGNSEKVTEEARKLAQNLIGTSKEELDIHSPSRVFKDIGKQCVTGLASGLKKYASLAVDEAVNVGTSAKDAIKNSLSKMSDIISGNIDTSPSIRPVLDLTDVQNGSKSLSSILGGSKIEATVSSSKASEVSGSIESKTPSESSNGGTEPVSKSYQFVQNNYSPKELSRAEIYRQTKNQFSSFKEALT